MTHESRKKIKKFNVLECWMFFLRAEGFFCNLDVLYGGLGIGKLEFLIQKNLMFFFNCKFFSIFGHHNPGYGLDPDPDRCSA